MSLINVGLVAERLDSISLCCVDLEEFRPRSIDEYLADRRYRYITERALQLIIQAAIDINDHILSKLSPGNTLTNFDAFIELGKYGVINSEPAKQLAQSAGLRNRLVHEYNKLDPNQVFRAIDFALQQYPIYVQQVTAYLMSLQADN